MYCVAAKTPAEETYNKAHKATYTVMEKALHSWKTRFPALNKGLQIKSEVVPAIIVATSILHNLAIDRNDPMPSSGGVTLDQPPITETLPPTSRGEMVRKQIMQTKLLGESK